MSALRIACDLENVEIVDLLIKHKADINKSDLKRCSPLHQACNEEHEEIAHMLSGQKQIKGADVNKSSIFNSCEKGYLPIIKLLIKDGVDLNRTDSTGLTSLMIAFKHLHFAVVYLLIENGSDSNIFPEIWKTIKNRTNIDEVPYFSIACRHGHEQIVKIFMKHGSDLLILDMIGDSPIIYALEGEHENIAILLLDHLKELGYKTKIQILSMALARGFETLATILTEACVQINDFDCNGYNPLILGCQKVDELLVDRSLSLEAVVHEVMNTSLKMASTNGHWKIVE
ncbi:unnamed protein product [Mytilus coruscus]|uniref:Uncharacterized protein n=1 Tax=Mytilus coruscus TaxID=42192 RepID=A0A6J8A7C6_MYTCO|nr:unnamed protein product [Mytilus coruscus]